MASSGFPTLDPTSAVHTQPTDNQVFRREWLWSLASKVFPFTMTVAWAMVAMTRKGLRPLLTTHWVPGKIDVSRMMMLTDYQIG